MSKLSRFQLFRACTHVWKTRKWKVGSLDMLKHVSRLGCVFSLKHFLRKRLDSVILHRIHVQLGTLSKQLFWQHERHEDWSKHRGWSKTSNLLPVDVRVVKNVACLGLGLIGLSLVGERIFPTGYNQWTIYTWKADFSQLRNQKVKPKMAEFEAILVRHPQSSTCTAVRQYIWPYA